MRSEWSAEAHRVEQQQQHARREQRDGTRPAELVEHIVERPFEAPIDG